MKSKHHNKIKDSMCCVVECVACVSVCLFESEVINDGQNIVRINPDCH